jgi:2',5'-phosphodiesterase
MSYNILADLYADSDFSRDFLFPACPEKYLNIDYRKLLLIREILGWLNKVECFPA